MLQNRRKLLHNQINIDRYSVLMSQLSTIELTGMKITLTHYHNTLIELLLTQMIILLI